MMKFGVDTGIVLPLMELTFRGGLRMEGELIKCTTGSGEGMVNSPKLWSIYAADQGKQLVEWQLK